MYTQHNTKIDRKFIQIGDKINVFQAFTQFVNQKQSYIKAVFSLYQSVILSRDGQYMMMGGSSGVVEVWRSHDLTLLYTYPPCDSSICSLALTHDHK